LERTVAYGHVVRLIPDDVTRIRLDPVWLDQEEPVLDFACRFGTHRVAGSILLAAEQDPLPVRVYAGERELLSEAWALALRGAAELLCVEYTGETRSTRASARIPTASRDQRRRRLPVQGRRTTRPEWLGHALTPTESTEALVASYVVGHFRRLLPGQNASGTALDNAASVGMIVPPGFTWVKPHTRGVPSDAALEFLWDATLPMSEPRGIADRGTDLA
jgi:hypothetical protein